jgi:ADP-ribose pyrophosphatase YjhB (NUDIX family)
MPHIHTTAGQHDLTVTAFIVRTDFLEPRVLLHTHRKLHTLLPVGGHVELLETPWQAMAHELTEESGYRLSQLKILQPKSRIKQLTKVVLHPYPLSMNTHDITPDHFHTDIQYGFVAEGDPDGEIKAGESADLQWLTRRELDELSEAEIFANVRETYRFLFDEVLKHWEHVSAGDFLLDLPGEYYHA